LPRHAVSPLTKTPWKPPREKLAAEQTTEIYRILRGVKGRVLDCKTMTTTMTEFRTRTTLIFRGESTEAITQLIQPGSRKPTMESMADRVYEMTRPFYFFKIKNLLNTESLHIMS